jgi:hypothetical protein
MNHFVQKFTGEKHALEQKVVQKNEEIEALKCRQEEDLQAKEK